MKPLLWLVLLTGLAPLRALSQGPDPVYGLGVCTSGSYHINQAVAPTPGPGGAGYVPAANDPGGHGFPGRPEEAWTGWVHGDPAGEAATRLPGSRPVPGKRPGRRAGLPRSHRMPPESSPKKHRDFPGSGQRDSEYIVN